MSLANEHTSEAYLRQIAEALRCRYSHKRVNPSTETDAYANGDVVFAPIEIPDIALGKGETVLLESVKIINNDDLAPPTDLIFLTEAVDIGAVNAAATLPTAGSAAYLATVKFTAANYTDLGDIRVAEKKDLGEIIKPTDDSKSIWVAGIARAAATYTSEAGISIITTFRTS